MAEVVAELETAFQRQSQSTFLQKFQHLRIQLEEIRSATNNFNDQNYRIIGVGGFGKVYKGEVTHSKGRSMVAINRLDLTRGQGIPKFWKEITMLSSCKHENLISLLGFCCEGSEMILVYELASRGSLDHHLNSPCLSWTQRLKICLDAAKGLSYLHDPKETIHCDVKSGNILLDDQWNAKVSDLRLSIMGSANEQHSAIVALAAGTRGYCDPLHTMTHTLTKESDVYSFGVVLFEVLCGRLCYPYRIHGDDENTFVRTCIESYKKKNLKDIVFKSPSIPPLDEIALEIFSDIAYRCLEVDREHRPRMATVVEELENALILQELISSFTYYKEIVESAEPLLNYRSYGELMQLLFKFKGVLLNKGKTWFSINKKGEHCEMRSFADCVEEYDRYHYKNDNDEYKKRARKRSRYQSEYNNSRFVGGTYYLEKKWKGMLVETRVKTQFLSPGITYTVNFVFKYMLPMKKARKGHQLIKLEYGLPGKRYGNSAYIACERKDGWWMCELCHFTSDQRKVDFYFQFYNHNDDERFIEAEGIEFWPLEKVDERQPILDSDANWQEKFPSDYKDMMKWSTNIVQWTTEKEAYSLLRKGFLIDDGKKWFSLDKNGKKCHMLSAVSIFSSIYNLEVLPSPESRFGEVIHDPWTLYMDTDIKSKLVSSAQITYAIYLVYKLPNDQFRMKAPFVVYDRDKSNSEDDSFLCFYLVSPQTQILEPKAGQNTHNPTNRLNIEGLPQERDDGWMEVQIWKFQTATINAPISLELKKNDQDYYGSWKGIIIEGVEFRPI
ncbi:hypothetical protein SSX86_031454 [Deinandra increscens subsp. villosa]|uniref:Protein kinase domain-containing protein n=1 Tax=Deinandra increscens subsp. villosa TaxID=3103831 RepID=A0AAP0C6G8_9ASTR